MSQRLRLPRRRWPLVDGRCLLAIAAVCALAAGCSKSHELETAPVRGIVTLDGAPVTMGYVRILPARGRTSSGAIQPDGTFVIGTYSADDGAQVGSHTVTVNPVPADMLPADAANVVPIPARYAQSSTSGLSFEVKPGEENVLNLELDSGDK